MKLSDRKIDTKKREEGAWVTDIPEWDELKLKVRGSGNKDWARRESELTRKIPREMRIKGLSKAQTDHITNTLLLECGLLDWRGPQNDDGSALAYSKDAARNYLFDPEHEPFRDAVLWACQMVATIGEAEIAADAEN